MTTDLTEVAGMVDALLFDAWHSPYWRRLTLGAHEVWMDEADERMANDRAEIRAMADEAREKARDALLEAVDRTRAELGLPKRPERARQDLAAAVTILGDQFRAMGSALAAAVKPLARMVLAIERQAREDFTLHGEGGDA